MKKEKKTIKTRIMEIVSVSPKCRGDTGYLKLTDEEINKIVDLFRQTFQRFIEETYKEADREIRKRQRDLNGVSLPSSMVFDIYYQKQQQWLKNEKI